MRYIVYVVAVLVAASIVVVLTRSSTPSSADLQPASTAMESEAAPQPPVVVGEKSQLVLHVPNMHCRFGCYPTVKETLAKQSGVAEVELAEQKDEVDIDNPRVVLTVGENFDADAAREALDAAGFAGSAVEEDKG